ncbi:Glycosyl transferase family 10 [Trypanosoma melophagium]|uniref:Glycosyl transferase family 10 n=1 Tax=Trypanosoma melophagium TaxID=715481 RepID=UPI00351A4AB3|nr:Glycosyl transferase family 10 [Trypanosoma melophagium]
MSKKIIKFTTTTCIYLLLTVILCSWLLTFYYAFDENVPPPKPTPEVESTIDVYDARRDVTVVPTRTGTYLCEYMTNATKIHHGCVQACSTEKDHNREMFNCYVRSHGSRREHVGADIVINHNGPVPTRHHKGRPYITLFYTGESNNTDKKRGNDAYQSLYDEVVSFHQHRRYYFTWVHRQQPYFVEILNENNKQGSTDENVTWERWQQRKSAVAVFVSRCKARRANAIRHLSRYYPVHSYGACARNQRIPPDCAAIAGRYPQKLCVFRKYKYAMALENSREKDYVTEKVYHALLSGAIPLYWGAPNIDDFLPSGRRSVVEVERFIPGQLGDAEAAAKVWDDGAGAFQKLGEFLQHLETDDAAVKQLLAWRHVKRAEEWGENFLDNMYHTDPICALCAEAREKRRKVEGGR